MAHRFSSQTRLRAAVMATGTGSVILVLLVGMPYILWQAANVPWPDRIGSWRSLGDRLAQPVTDSVMVDLLAMVGWVCWAAFACSILRESTWYAVHLPRLLRDRTAHTAHVDTLPLQRAFAAMCVGTLVLALISLWRPFIAHAHQHTLADGVRAGVASMAPAHPGPAEDGHSRTGKRAAPELAAWSTPSWKATHCGRLPKPISGTPEMATDLRPEQDPCPGRRHTADQPRRDHSRLATRHPHHLFCLTSTPSRPARASAGEAFCLGLARHPHHGAIAGAGRRAWR